MTLEQAMTHCFRDEPCGGEKRKWFSSKEAAEEYSESLKSLWPEGLGQIYGPFISSKVFWERWWEVSYSLTDR